MLFANYVDHSVDIYDMVENLIVSVPKSGRLARVRTKGDFVGSFCSKDFSYRKYNEDGSYEDIPLKGNPQSGALNFFRSEYSDVEGFPEVIESGVYYIVSSMVASRINHPQVIAPGQIIRDASGKAIGCCGLSYTVGK